MAQRRIDGSRALTGAGSEVVSDEKKTTTERPIHWLHGLGALCGAPGTVTITWSREHVTCEQCNNQIKDQPDTIPP